MGHLCRAFKFAPPQRKGQKMIRIKQFRYAWDNFSYLIYGASSAVAIDAGAVKPILSFAHRCGLQLKRLLNTHMHPDHTSGNAAVLKATRAEFLNPDELMHLGSLELEGRAIRIYPTPGHTNDSVCFHIGRFLVTGDTLFNGTVGNCFSGDLKRFYTSIKCLAALPEDTIIYAGHDYVRDAATFAKTLEPENVYIDHFLDAYNPAHVCSTLRDEFRINPYLRFNEERIVSVLKSRGLPVDTEYQRWVSLMSVE